MKKTLLALALIATNCNLKTENGFAQQSYSFSQSTSTYTDLANPTSLNNSTFWDFGPSSSSYFALDISTLVPNFYVFDIGCWQARIYGNVVQFFDNSSNQLVYLNALAVFYPDGIKDRGTSGNSLSPVSYEASGTWPNKILKIEWKNAGRDSASSDFMNVQMWLYQSDKSIEYHYGSCSITNPSTVQLSIGLGHIYQPTSNYIEDDFLDGTPSNIVFVPGDTAQFFGVPANGKVYRFTKNAVGINTPNNLSAIKIYPTLASSTINVMNAETNSIIKIYDITGKQVLSTKTSNENFQMNISSLESGMYFIELNSSGNLHREKFIKQNF